MAPASLPGLRSIVAALAQDGVRVLVFGGWAEELYGLIRARDHRDVDLLLVDPDERVLDAFLVGREIREKRSSHKRAFETDGTLVELFIAHSENGNRVTYFWQHLRWVWPADVDVTVRGLPLVSRAALDGYRRSWSAIQSCRPPSS
jgi:hypothetical protein